MYPPRSRPPALLLPVVLLLVCAALGASACSTTTPAQRPDAGQTQEPTATGETWDEAEILAEARGAFGEATEGLAEIIARTFEDHGSPSAFIVGEEASGALGVGLRYGRGELRLPDQEPLPVWWQGVSIGFDAGGNASRCFILIYNLKEVDDLFQRFPGVEGSLYFIAGVGVTYMQSDDLIVAPIRSGVGWRQGANVGTLKITREETTNPF